MPESKDGHIADQRFRQIADRLPTPMAIWAGDGFSYANPPFVALTGCAAADLEHIAWPSLLAESFRDTVNRQQRDLAAGAAATLCADVMVVPRGNGDPKWVEQTLTACEGRPPAILVTAVDISARRWLEDALSTAEAKYRRLFDDDLTGIATLSPAGIIIECNRALARMFVADDIPGQPFAAFVNDPSYVSRLLDLVRAEGRVEAAELQGRRANGDVIVVAARLVGSVDALGHLASVQLLLAEMTDRKRLEAHLIGIQRTEAIGRLAGGLAHDFNNLLTVVGGHSDYLLETLPEGDPRRSSAQSIHQASHRAAALTRQLLAFGRRQVFHLRVVEIRQLLDEAQPMLARALGDGIALQVEIGAASPKISADPVQLEQILVNLALNARDAMPDGGTLGVRAGLMETDQPPPAQRWIRPGAYLRIDVTDSGPGMDEAVRARVFEPFFTTKHLGRGNGLGLATVYGIVKQSGGYIWVDSEAGRGTTFTVLFPALAETEPEAAAPQGETRPHEAVLIMEQDDNLRALIADALRRRGYHVLDTDSATRATELFNAHSGRIDLLVSDVRHLDAAGPAIAERLRAAAPRLRVLYMSATSTMVPPIAAGIGFIQKPFSLHAFADKVRQILDAEP